jgi:GLPGLI family protein
MKQLLSLIFFSVGILHARSQQVYITKGKIEFEKTVNTYKVLEENYAGSDNTMWAEAFKKSMAKTGSSYFDLYFSNDKSLYKPGREVIVAQRPPDWVNGQATDNIVFTDLEKQTGIAQKHVYENTYLVQDSLHSYNWKISNDTRTIAGLECRKATTVIMDSVFVVAFFTEQILCTSGPEGFTGLPGMILGIAIPRLHTTWYATKLELIEIKETDLAAPKRGKAINQVQLQEQLKSLMKNWGRNANRNIWQIMI